MKFKHTSTELAVAAISFVLFAMATGAQAPNASTTAPAYEVASIRQNLNPIPRFNSWFTADGYHAMDVTLRWVLQEAYGMADYDRWSGGPAWLDMARFDIEAKYDVDKYPILTMKQRQAMLQQLLGDRFKLVVHHEAKEFPLYALVVGKNGPNFEETQPSDLRKVPVYGVMCTNMGRGMTAIEMQGCTMAQFAATLGGQARADLGRKVADQTGLAGYYTMKLHWAPMDAANPPSTPLGVSDPGGPSIFTAVKEQLGLELKPTKGPLDTIVIDHVEMPTEN